MKPTFTQFSNFIKEITNFTEIKLKNSFEHHNFHSHKKQDGTILTNSDLEIETYIRSEINKRFPSDSQIGEEYSDIMNKSSFSWIIDPIDGTFSFANGVTLFSTLIGLLENDEPLYGSINFPMIDKSLLLGDNYVANINGTTLKTTRFNGWEDSLILTTDFNRLEQSRFIKPWKNLQNMGAICRTWGDCYGYYLLCSGKADIMLDLDMKNHDILPIIPILKGAGVEIIDLSVRQDFTSIIACKNEIKDELLDLFS